MQPWVEVEERMASPQGRQSDRELGMLNVCPQVEGVVP
jgi:hypothetical protein